MTHSKGQKIIYVSHIPEPINSAFQVDIDNQAEKTEEMIGSKKQLNLKNIRTMLIEGFTTEELRRLCYDESSFRPVYDNLGQDTGKAKIIDVLIEYGEQKLLIDLLLDLAKQHNPARYEKHQPYYDVTPITTVSNSITKQVRSLELNMRLRPGVNQPIVTILPQNAEVQLLGETQEFDGGLWTKIRVGQDIGWVNQQFLK